MSIGLKDSDGERVFRSRSCISEMNPCYACVSKRIFDADNGVVYLGGVLCIPALNRCGGTISHVEEPQIYNFSNDVLFQPKVSPLTLCCMTFFSMARCLLGVFSTSVTFFQ